MIIVITTYNWQSVIIGVHMVLLHNLGADASQLLVVFWDEVWVFYKLSHNGVSINILSKFHLARRERMCSRINDMQW